MWMSLYRPIDVRRKPLPSARPQRTCPTLGLVRLRGRLFESMNAYVWLPRKGSIAMNCVNTKSVRWMRGRCGTTQLRLALALVGVLASSVEAGDCTIWCEDLDDCAHYNVEHHTTDTGADCRNLAGDLECNDGDLWGFIWDSGVGETRASDDRCVGVPTVSEWGLVVLTLLGMTIGTIRHARRRVQRVGETG